MKKKYSFTLGILLILLLGNSMVFGQNQYYLDMDSFNSYIYYDDDPILSRMDAATDYTIEAWIFPITGRVDHLDVILHRDQCFSLVMNDGDNDGDVEDFYFEVYDIGSTSWVTLTTSGDENLILDSWNHIAVINNSSSNTLKMYVNDTEVTSGIHSSKTLRPASANYNLFIGAGGIANPNNSFGGFIDEVRLKNVAENFNNLQGNLVVTEYTSDGNTAALFHFNEGSGLTSVNEASANNASLVNTIYWRGWRYKSGHSIPLGPRYVWNGIYSNSNFYGPNWDTGSGPSSSDDVIVPSGTANDLWIDEDDAFACTNFLVEANANMKIFGCGNVTAVNFTIEANATLELETFLTVTNALTNNNPVNGITIKSYGNEIGSLIHSQSGVDALIERHIHPYTPGDPDDGWHYLSSPVGDFTIGVSDFLPGVNDDLFAYDAASNMWLNYYGTGFSKFEKGKGYLCSYQSNTTHMFTNCAINVGDVSFDDIGGVSGWELLGNPFSSAIDWATGTWSRSNIHGAQVYSEDLRNWLVASVIPATQGFFVEVTAPVNHITIPADARIHNAQPWYKNQKADDNKIEIKLTGDQNKGWDYTTIVFNDAATEAYDPEYDYHKLFGMPSAPQLYTSNSNQEIFCVNSQSIPNDERLIPLNIRIGYDGVYKIEIKESSIESEGNIYLEDLKTGVLTKLNSKNHYSFLGQKGEEANRFMLHFNSTTSLEEIENEAKVNIYSNDHTLFLNSTESISGKVMVYDMGGRLILSKQVQNSNMHTISAEQLSGVYLVHFVEVGNISTQKVIIQ